jgi:alpha-galactosidase
MLEVGNGGMTYDEYKTHFSMWAAVKSPLIMGNKLDQLSPEDYAILVNPAVLAINQDPLASSISRKIRTQVAEKDRYGFGEVQVWSGSLVNGDQVVAFLNGGNASAVLTWSLVDVFGGLKTNTMAASAWDLFDVWGNATVMPVDVAAAVLNGTLDVGSTDYYYNASRTEWAVGLNQSAAATAANTTSGTLLLGTPSGSVASGGSLSATVPSHGIQMWRLRPAQPAARKRDEL